LPDDKARHTFPLFTLFNCLVDALSHVLLFNKEPFYGEEMPRMVIKVDAYSGYRADERPRSFTIKERVFEVKEVLDRWYGEGHDYFKLLADDGYKYIIRHDREKDEWELVMMEK